MAKRTDLHNTNSPITSYGRLKLLIDKSLTRLFGNTELGTQNRNQHLDDRINYKSELLNKKSILNQFAKENKINQFTFFLKSKDTLSSKELEYNDLKRDYKKSKRQIGTYVKEPSNVFYNVKLLLIIWSHFIIEFFAFACLIVISIYSLYGIGSLLLSELIFNDEKPDLVYFIGKIITNIELLFLAPLAYLIINGFLRIYYIRYPDVFDNRGVDPEKFKEKYFFIGSLLGVVATSMVKALISEPVNYVEWNSFFFCTAFPIIAHVLVFFVILKFYKMLSH